MKPILFSTAMVQAILEGRKTQTRRIVKGLEDCSLKHKEYKEAPWNDKSFEPSVNALRYGRLYCALCGNGTSPANDYEGIKIPYNIGDILWVRETWAQWDYPSKAPFAYAYKADGFTERYGAWERDTPNKLHDIERIERWKPSIFMPREACRLFLKIKSVRVERLQDISEEDAKAEGVQFIVDDVIGLRYKDYLADASGYGDPAHDFPTVSTAKESFQTLWDRINAKAYPWKNNPYVWVIEFEKQTNL